MILLFPRGTSQNVMSCIESLGEATLQENERCWPMLTPQRSFFVENTVPRWQEILSRYLLQAITAIPRCRRCPRVAESITTLPTIAAPLRPCSRCSASAAAALPPLTQPICRQVQGAPDGGKFTAFPPVVRRARTAVPTAQDVRLDAERWGGSGGGGCRSWRERD